MLLGGARQQQWGNCFPSLAAVEPCLPGTCATSLPPPPLLPQECHEAFGPDASGVCVACNVTGDYGDRCVRCDGKDPGFCLECEQGLDCLRLSATVEIGRWSGDGSDGCLVRPGGVGRPVSLTAPYGNWSPLLHP